MILWHSKPVANPNTEDWCIHSAFRLALMAQWKPFPMFGLFRQDLRKSDCEWNHGYYGYYLNLRGWRCPLFGYYHDCYDGDLYTFGLGWIQFSWEDHWVMSIKKEVTNGND